MWPILSGREWAQRPYLAGRHAEKELRMVVDWSRIERSGSISAGNGTQPCK